MSEDKKPANIFEAASQMFGSGKKKQPTKKNKEKGASLSGKKEPSEEDLKAYEDIAASFKRMQQFHKELREHYAEICKKVNLSHKELQGYLKDKKNFSSSEWNYMQKERKFESQKMWDSVGEKAKEAYQEKMQRRREIKKKKKNLGLRKGWIEVR